jgi:flavin-binding protein dodecin
MATNAREVQVSDHVYSVTEVVGSSSESLEGAIENAVETASGTLNNLEWFEVSEIRGHIEDGRVAHYQVGVKLGFRYDK